MAFYNINSNIYMITFFIFALLEVLLCSGITYGWASIVVVFKLKYFYMGLCKEWYAEHNKTIAEVINLDYKQGTIPGCPAQDARLNLVFTVGMFSLCVIIFPAGIFIDKVGPRIARGMGGVLYVISCLGLGFIAIGYENALFPTFISIAMGGSLLSVSVYQVSNIIFRKARSRVMCILHGAFDSSAVLLLIFKVIFEVGVDFRHIMFVYTGICFALMTFGTFVLIPPLKVLLKWDAEEREVISKKRMLSGSVDQDFPLKSKSATYRGFAILSVDYDSPATWKEEADTDNNIMYTLEEPKIDEEIEKSHVEHSGENYFVKYENDNDEVALVKSSSFKEQSILKSILNPLYLLELVFLMTFQLKLWYFAGGLPDFLGRLAHNDKDMVSKYINLFGYIQFGGIFVTPFIGLIFDREQLLGKTSNEILKRRPAENRLNKLRASILPFVITSILCGLFCTLTLIESTAVQVPSYILYTTVRGFLYANHGAFMGSAFPATQFGTLYGFGIFTAGCFGVLEYACFELTSGLFHGDPFNANVILFVLVIVGLSHPIYLWWYCRQETKKLELKSHNNRL